MTTGDRSADTHDRPAGLPVTLLLLGRRVLVVGAGSVATRKAEQLLAEGAVVHVVAPEVGRLMEALEDDDLVTISRRPFEPSDLDDVWLAISATGIEAVDASVYEAGEAARVLVNAADGPAHCSFTLMSVLRRGDVRVAVGTSGRSPALAAWLRRRLEEQLGPELADLCDLLASERDAIHASGHGTEGLPWAAALDAGLLELVRSGRIGDARALLREYVR